MSARRMRNITSRATIQGAPPKSFWQKVKAVLSPDSDGDGMATLAEWGENGLRYLVLALSIGLCAYTVGFDVLGPAFGATNSAAAGMIGVFFGALIGAVAAFFEAFGVPLGKPRFAFVAMIISVGAMLLLGFNLIAESRTQLLSAEAASVAKLEQADALSDTTDVTQRMADARADLERATRRRDEAEALRGELAGLPSGQWNARVAEIQTVIGATPDGVKYNRTTDAMAAFVAEAQQEYETAVARRDAAQTAIDNVRETISSGQVAAVKGEAREALQIESFFGLFRTPAKLVLELQGVDLIDDPTTPMSEINERVDELAWPIALGFVLVVVCFLNFTNFLLNRDTLHRIAGEGPPDDAIDIDRSGRLLMGPGGGSVADDGDMQVDRSGRRIYVADDAPRQPGESASAARERLQRAYKALERASAVDDPEDEVFIAEEAALVEEIARRKKASAQEQRHRARLAALERQLKETEMASRPVPGLDALDAMKRRLAEMDGANGMATPRPEPEIAARANGVGDDLRRRLALEAEFRRLDQEWRSPVTTPGRKDAIEARMHEIHAELVPIMQRLEEIARTG